MPNIVYVLTNPAMPGFVKIGMTDRPDVQDRMADLYKTGVPLPFDCVIAWEVEGKEAADIERALHTAFDPSRVNPSREFFELKPEQVEVLLRVMPGRDVTPQVIEETNEGQADERRASSEYKKSRSRTTEHEFLDSLSLKGKVVYERVLALGKQSGMRINWGLKGFSLNVVSNGARIVVCYGYPPSAYNQKIYTDLASAPSKSSVTEDVIEALRSEALNTGLFEPVGKGIELAAETDKRWEEPQLAVLMGWLNSFVEQIRESETVN